MKILLLDPYLSYSHRVWLDGLIANLDHKILSLTLPAYHWKWRMHGGTLELAQQLGKHQFKPDMIIATDMLDLSLFMAQCRRFLSQDLPILLYFHENQLTYPISVTDKEANNQYDNHYAFINFTSALLADQLIFNSEFHRQAYFLGLPDFLRKFPKNNISLSIQQLSDKSSVIYPGFSSTKFHSPADPKNNLRPIILWNHRWEYDKAPETFFEVMQALSEAQYDFDLVILGQRFDRVPETFATNKSILANHILQWGFVEGRRAYDEWLTKSDIVISTSNQDYFGISVVEAIAAGCYPLLPDRLAFPEHIPAYLHHKYLYKDKSDLHNKLKMCLTNWPLSDVDRGIRQQHVHRYRSEIQAQEYEKIFRNLSKQVP